MSDISEANFQSFGEDVLLYPGQRVIKIGDKMFPVGIGNNAMPPKLSGITATAEDIIEGKVSVDTEGSEIVGTLKPVEFYKCANIYGPYEVETVVISGCPTAEVNGTYLPTEFTTQDWEGNTQPVYSNGTYYYFYEPNNYMSWGIGTDYTSSTMLYMGSVGSSWSDASDWMTVEGMSAANGTATLDTDVPKTWDGYKAVLTDGVYTFEETLTGGLTYSDVKPQKYGIYNGDVTQKLDWFNDGSVWSRDLVFYAPLTTDLDYAETGQALNRKGTELATVDGVACAYFDGNSYMTPDVTDLMQGQGAFTVVMDICPTEAGYSTALHFSGRHFGYINNNPTRLSTGGLASATQEIDLNQWMTVMQSRDDNGNYIVFVGEVVKSYATKTDATAIYMYDFAIGSTSRTSASEAYRGYIRNVRVYKRGFTYDELRSYANTLGFPGSLPVVTERQRLLYWNMNDTGDAAVDSVYGVSLAKVNSVTPGVTGVSGTCWESTSDAPGYLSGTNDKVALPQNFTLVFNVYINSTSSGCLIDFGGYDSNTGFGVWYNGSNLAPRIGSSYNNYGTAISASAWHNVAFTYDGKAMRMYLDKALTQTVGYTLPIIHRSVIKMFMRGDKDGEGQTYAKLDEVSLYNYAMTDTEIAAL